MSTPVVARNRIATPYIQYDGTFQAEPPPPMASQMFRGSPDFIDRSPLDPEQNGAGKRRHMPTVDEAMPVRWHSGVAFITAASPLEPIVRPWGVHEDFRGVIESDDHLVIVYREDIKALTRLVNTNPAKRPVLQVAQIREYLGAELTSTSGAPLL